VRPGDHPRRPSTRPPSANPPAPALLIGGSRLSQGPQGASVATGSASSSTAIRLAGPGAPARGRALRGDSLRADTPMSSGENLDAGRRVKRQRPFAQNAAGLNRSPTACRSSVRRTSYRTAGEGGALSHPPVSRRVLQGARSRRRGPGRCGGQVDVQPVLDGLALGDGHEDHPWAYTLPGVCRMTV
jgi:hypothetical protein